MPVSVFSPLSASAASLLPLEKVAAKRPDEASACLSLLPVREKNGKPIKILYHNLAIFARKCYNKISTDFKEAAAGVFSPPKRRIP